MTLRRRSFGDEAALEAGVEHLLREEVRVGEQITPAAVSATVTPTPVADSYLIASETFSRPEIIDAADFVTANSSDQTTINGALAQILPQGVPGVGQGSLTVVLAAGRYEADGLITIGSFGTLKGTGRGSNFNPVTGTEFTLDTGSEIAHLTFIST